VVDGFLFDREELHAAPPLSWLLLEPARIQSSIRKTCSTSGLPGDMASLS
jgi:hypothetical protein